jgi:heterodisulfide reductase subunit A-like polyferredoxin
MDPGPGGTSALVEITGVRSIPIRSGGIREAYPHVMQKEKEEESFMRDSPVRPDPEGSVVIVGGGIAGMQAALDVADSGFFVYMVERSPAIGGAMAQLDKTFPTNDCAM